MPLASHHTPLPHSISLFAAWTPCGLQLVYRVVDQVCFPVICWATLVLSVAVLATTVSNKSKASDGLVVLGIPASIAGKIFPTI